MPGSGTAPILGDKTFVLMSSDERALGNPGQVVSRPVDHAAQTLAHELGHALTNLMHIDAPRHTFFPIGGGPKDVEPNQYRRLPHYIEDIVLGPQRPAFAGNPENAKKHGNRLLKDM
jgi:hypothetical protein